MTAKQKSAAKKSAAAAKKSAAAAKECRAKDVGHRSCKCGGEYCPVN
jgi:hypothetical protein